MKVIVTGAGGQLGWELQRTKPEGLELLALNRKALDICDVELVNQKVAQISPEIIINAAAYTAVDKAEHEPERAFAVNAQGPANLAQALVDSNARLIHVSTDFVFDGTQGYPYHPHAPPNPVNVYGASKYKGESKVLEVLGDACLVIRTSWVYSTHGHNFVKTMLRLMAERDTLGVVADQVGTPTWAHDLAQTIWALLKVSQISGIQHWTNAGVASWYDFAEAIQEEALDLKLLDKAIPIVPLTTEDYVTAAKRPSFTVLDKTPTWKLLGAYAPHWRKSLRTMLGRMIHE